MSPQQPKARTDGHEASTDCYCHESSADPNKDSHGPGEAKRPRLDYKQLSTNFTLLT